MKRKTIRVIFGILFIVVGVVTLLHGNLWSFGAFSIAGAVYLFSAFRGNKNRGSGYNG